eukprot:c4295_g1_i1 orf=999-1754(+)
MGSIEVLGITLTVIFAGLVLLFLAELYYIFLWKTPACANRRVNDVGLEYREGDAYVQEAAFVGSFGGWSLQARCSPPGWPLQSEYMGKYFSTVPSEIPEIGGLPRLLFTIKEETREDMEVEDSKLNVKVANKASKQVRGELLAQLSSGSSTPVETPFFTPPCSPSVNSPFVSPSPVPSKSSSCSSSLTPFAACAVKSSLSELKDRMLSGSPSPRNSASETYPENPVFSPEFSPRLSSFRTPSSSLSDLPPI